MIFHPMLSKTCLAAGLFVLICSTGAAEDEGAGPATPPLSAPWQKKLIEYGWDNPTPAFIAEHIRDMEKRPFDGLIFRLAGGTDVLDPKPWDDAKFAADLEAIPRIEWKQFTDNFVVMLAASNEDWENDEHWTNILKHAQQMTRAARLAQCVGICFDAEPYGENPWAYKKGPVTDTARFEEFEGVVRRRGSQFMRSIQTEISSPKVLLFYTFSYFQNLCVPMDHAARKRRQARNASALLPAFIEGMLLASNPGAEIIDGNEDAYYYFDSAKYFTSYHAVTQRARYMVTPEVWPAYREHYRMGQALYVDQYYGLRQEKVLGDFMLPEERPKWMEHNTYWALYTADRYVWCYSERMNWWKGNDVPPGCEDAVRRARANVNAGEPLGFSLEPIVASAQKRRSEAQSAGRYARMSRRTADIARLPAGSAPAVDGNVDKAIWQGIAPLPPFVLVGAPDTPAKGQTSARAAYDARAIYLAFHCDEPNPDHLPSEKLAPNDMAIFEGNVVEVFINVTRSDSGFFHFAINPSGSHWAARHLKDQPEPLSQPWEHAARLEQNGWTAEIAIPWSTLGISGPPVIATSAPTPDTYAPRPAPPVRVNLGRERPQDNEYSTWSPTAQGFVESGNFGTWRFK
jgi:hypothetical protein